MKLPRTNYNALLPWLMWLLATLFYIKQFLLRFSTRSFSSQLTAVFHLNALELTDLNDIFYISFMVMQLITGILVDRFGPRLSLTLGCLFCAIGCFIFAMAPHSYELYFARILMGIGAPVAFIGTIKLISNWFDAHQFTILIGITIALGSAGAFLGESVLSLLLSHANWKTMMFYMACSSLVLAGCLYSIVRNKPERSHPHVIEHNKTSLTRVLNELFSGKVLTIIGFFSFLQIPLFCFAGLWYGHLLIVEHNISIYKANFISGLYFIGYAIGSLIFSFYFDRIKQKNIAMIMTTAAASGVLFLLLSLPHNSVIFDACMMSLFGGLSGISTFSYPLIKKYVSRNALATITSIMLIISILLSMVANQIIRYLIDNQQSVVSLLLHFHVYSINQYKNALIVIPISMLISLLFACLFSLTHLPHSSFKLRKEK